ncbi:MAG: hypothetical protein IKI38_05310 [Mogibacterium sp.]|nr:hypothetical protein [Mogibacterium sp.]
MNMQLNRAIIDAQRNIDDQIGKLQGYLTEIKTTQTAVAAVLGDEEEYAKKMNTQLEQTKETVEKAVGMLANAKEKLSQVGLVRGRR